MSSPTRAGEARLVPGPHLVGDVAGLLLAEEVHADEVGDEREAVAGCAARQRAVPGGAVEDHQRAGRGLDGNSEVVGGDLAGQRVAGQFVAARHEGDGSVVGGVIAEQQRRIGDLGVGGGTGRGWRRCLCGGRGACRSDLS